jgi:hypothetical protein
MITAVWRLAPLLLLASCIGGRPIETLPEPPAADQVATVTIVRDEQLAGAARIHAVLVDERAAANLNSGQSVTLRLPAGMRVIGIECGGSGWAGDYTSMTIQLAAGETYRLRTYTNFNGDCQLRLAGRIG